MMPKIYPILKPGDWIGLENGVLHQVLIGNKSSPSLVIGYGYSTEESLIFINKANLSESGAKDVYSESMRNLNDMEVVFTSSERLNDKVLTVSGEEFCSESILSKKHMDEAHRLLGSDELLVSIPRRRCMMITPRNVDDDIYSKFVFLHDDAWQDDSYGNAPIANMLFVVKNGAIDGVISMDQ